MAAAKMFLFNVTVYCKKGNDGEVCYLVLAATAKLADAHLRNFFANTL